MFRSGLVRMVTSWYRRSVLRLCYVYAISIAGVQRMHRTFYNPNIIRSDLRLQKIIADPTDTKPVRVAIYSDSNGREWLVKTWGGVFDDFHRLSLENEAAAYMAFQYTDTREFASGAVVHIPTVESFTDVSGEFVLIREFIDGVVLSDVDDQRDRERVFWLVLSQFKTVARGIPKEWLIRIRELPSWIVLASYWMFLPVALAARRGYRRDVCMSVWLYFKLFVLCIPHAFSKHVLVHRDIHAKNIVLRGKQIVLIDMGECVLANPVLEYVYAVTAESVMGESQYLGMIDRIYHTVLYDKRQRRLFYLFLLVRCVGLLSEANMPQLRAQKFCRIISYIRTALK